MKKTDCTLQTRPTIHSNPPVFKAPLKAIFALLLILLVKTVFAQSSAFSYQGQLNNNGAPASGLFELQFTLFDASTNGIRIAGPVTNSATLVTNGVFSVKIDFGPKAFNGAPRWLEIGVRTNAATNQFFILKPRQPLADLQNRLKSPIL
jgi:hypothetical protein